MRLTNIHRSAIKERALAARFDPLDEKLAAEERDLGMRFYKSVIPEAERRAASKLSKRWLARDKCLRFSARGANLAFNVREEVIVPSNGGYCRVLGALDEADADAAIAHHDALNDVRRQRKEAGRQLGSLLESIGTLKQLEEIWPEGKPFYQHLGSEDRLPVPIVRDVNAALGLTAVAA